MTTQPTKQEQLASLYQQLEQAAPNLPLATKASDIVPGEGDPDADVFFIGEAPGYHESVQRRPFVGRSGKLLRKTIKEVDLADEDVYIGNIVKVRPPENRDPTTEEIAAYKTYLDKELEIIQPKLVATLGRFSMAKFLRDVKISQVHGRLHKVQWESQLLFVLPLYHPAAALRNGKVRESFVADMAKIPKIIAWLEENEDDFEFEAEITDSLF